MTEGYTKHLAELHAKQTIPAEILNDLLREISPAQVISRQRIIAGESNEVYDIGFADRLHVIARISRHEDKHFAQEQWAIRECSQRGVPVPEMLGVWDRSTAGQPLHICIQQKIEGVLLSNANVLQHMLHELVVQAGALLSRIHDIPIKGFGYINGQGEGTFLTPEAENDAFEYMEAEFHALAKRLDISEHAMSRALRLVVDDGRVVQSADACLTHNDFCAKHILIANDTIAGIIDFGEVAGSEPLSDFVRWDYYDSTRFPLAWLQEGYANQHVFDHTFMQRLRVKRVAFSLWVMRWYAMSGYAEGVAHARATFMHDLAQLDQ